MELRLYSPVRCLFAGFWVLASIWSCGCQSDNIFARAKKLGVDLPGEGVGPVKQFVSKGAQVGSSSKQIVFFEWPDGTETVRGKKYDRRRIITVESGKEPYVEFTYSRTEGGKILGIENQHLAFGEYFAQPANLAIGARWRSRDNNESSDCQVVDIKALNIAGHRFDNCTEVHCEQKTTMPDGELFRGKTVSHSCPRIGTVKSESKSSNGKVTIITSSDLESFTWNGTAPSDE